MDGSTDGWIGATLKESLKAKSMHDLSPSVTSPPFIPSSEVVTLIMTKLFIGRRRGGILGADSGKDDGGGG